VRNSRIRLTDSLSPQSIAQGVEGRTPTTVI
jgi:hypothetical protein